MASEDPQLRSASGSNRSTSSRSRQNPQQQLSQIEKSVTHLLVATKQLLETLTLWSRGSATETEVSDVYVRLGYEFNIACRAFNSIGVDTADLGPIPDLLRVILEETLSQEASQASLDRFLPRIRDIIINLLHGLKKKQSRIRQKTTSTSSTSTPKDAAVPTRQTSSASATIIDPPTPKNEDSSPVRQQSTRSYAPRPGIGEFQAPEPPPRNASVQSQGSRNSPRRESFVPNGIPVQRDQPQDTTQQTTAPSAPSATLPGMAVAIPMEPQELADTSIPPVPPPKQVPMQKDALAALQRGPDLERRASRRFSAYQINKHLGTGTGVGNIIAPAQHSPIPNRGRETQESINAVRSRSTYLHSRNRSAFRVGNEESSPVRNQTREKVPQEPSPGFANDRPATDVDDPYVEAPRPSQDDNLPGQAAIGIAITEEPPTRTEDRDSGSVKYTPATDSVLAPSVPVPSTPPPTSQSYGAGSSPQPGKDLTLFLQYKSKIKKFVLPDGADLTTARLQLAFIEKFAWNTQNNGVDLPEIYIQDTVSGIRHELEDLSDIKERSVLVLNIEALDEVKRHIDNGVEGLKRMIEGIKSIVDEQQNALQLVSDQQQEAAKGIAGLAAAPAPAPAILPPSTSRSQLPAKDTVDQLGQIQALRRDLAVVRQTYTSFVSDMNSSMAVIRTKASAVKAKTAEAITPKMDADTGRAYVNNGKKQLQEESEKIVSSVDDLQDIVEDLRKDVVTRGVRPLSRQLETVSKEISSATAQLKKLQEFLKREKPVWTKIWEKELQVVCDDRDLLTMQEDLCVDLEDDLDKAAATFALVEQATRQQHLDNPKSAQGGARSSSRTLKPVPTEDPHKAKDGVLGEVKALRPNHETRLEAIERAEKARQRELDSRKGGEFQQELGSFVDEGRLKKSGGFEEVERVRKIREERARKEYYERMAARLAGRAEEQPATNGPESDAPTLPALALSEGLALDLGEGGSGSGSAGESSGDSPEGEFVEAKSEPGTPPAAG